MRLALSTVAAVLALCSHASAQVPVVLSEMFSPRQRQRKVAMK